jgi:hypothetical protein
LIKPLVFDTTPLIYVIRVSLAESRKRLRDPKILPHSVYDEFLRGEPLGKREASVIRELVENGVLNLALPADTSLVRKLIRLAAEDER